PRETPVRLWRHRHSVGELGVSGRLGSTPASSTTSTASGRSGRCFFVTSLVKPRSAFGDTGKLNLIIRII
ncbi:MAG: hypothetical protein KH850_02755, partial [Alistipes sp.]|uniref:hypothetical protein n=1 Tax=Alistipes sp. TaxID=1872444 RepID=UPI001DA6AE14